MRGDSVLRGMTREDDAGAKKYTNTPPCLEYTVIASIQTKHAAPTCLERWKNTRITDRKGIFQRVDR